MVVPVTPPVNPHRMVTRTKAGFRMHPDRLVLTHPETVFCSQPIGFADPAHSNLVYRLHKSLYRLK
jgi:hypothetical protein